MHKGCVNLADVILKTAQELNITSLRKPFWELKYEIKNAVENGTIKGYIGREIEVEINDYTKFIQQKKAKLNIKDAETNEDIKELIVKMLKLNLSANEILSVLCCKFDILDLMSGDIK